MEWSGVRVWSGLMSVCGLVSVCGGVWCPCVEWSGVCVWSGLVSVCGVVCNTSEGRVRGCSLRVLIGWCGVVKL